MFREVGRGMWQKLIIIYQSFQVNIETNKQTFSGSLTRRIVDTEGKEVQEWRLVNRVRDQAWRTGSWIWQSGGCFWPSGNGLRWVSEADAKVQWDKEWVAVVQWRKARSLAFSRSLVVNGITERCVLFFGLFCFGGRMYSLCESF